MLFTSNSLHLLLGHLHGVGKVTNLLNSVDALAPIGVEDKTKKARHEAVKVRTSLMANAFTIGAACNPIFYAAASDLAPCRLAIIVATGALTVGEASACTAVEAAVGNLLRIGYAMLTITHLFLFY